jgi:hypothetical protein
MIQQFVIKTNKGKAEDTRKKKMIDLKRAKVSRAPNAKTSICSGSSGCDDCLGRGSYSWYHAFATQEGDRYIYRGVENRGELC